MVKKEMCDNGKVKHYQATQASLKDVQRRLDDAEKRMDAVANGPGRKALARDARPDWQQLTVAIEALKARMTYLDLIVRMDGVSAWPEWSLSQLRLFDRVAAQRAYRDEHAPGVVLAGSVAGYLVALVGVVFFDALRMTVRRRS